MRFGWDTSKVTNMMGMFFYCMTTTSMDVSSLDTSNVTDMTGMFLGCGAFAFDGNFTRLDLSQWNTSKVTNMSMMFGVCSVESLDLAGWDTSNVTTMESMFEECGKLQTVTLGKDFKFVGTNGYLPTPSSDNISGADGKWYVAGLTKCYTPAELAKVIRVRAVTYSVIPGTDPGTGSGSVAYETDVRWPVQKGYLLYTGSEQSPDWSGYDSTKLTIGGTTSGVDVGSYTAIFAPKDGYCWPDGTADPVNVKWVIVNGAVSVPSQSGTLTYTGKVQSPSWDGYDSDKMTIGGMTSGTNARSYTAKFTPKDGYCWIDGTTSTKEVLWSIGKAPGSLTLSDSAVTIDYGTTATLTVTRAGDGKISATSSDTGVATVSVSGNTVTISKKSNGVAVITVEVAEGTNHTAPEAKLCSVTCKTAPILASRDSWYKGTTDKATITKISLVDSYSATGDETESWDASAAQNGSVMAYLNGTELIIAGNGFGKICANEDSAGTFKGFTSVTTISGTNLLDTSKVSTAYEMFGSCEALTELDLSGWDTSKVTSMDIMFRDCRALTKLNVSGWNTTKVTYMSSVFDGCWALTSIEGLSGWDTSSVTGSMYRLFSECRALTSLDVSGWDTSKVTSMGSMFSNCKALTSLDLSGWNTSSVTAMYGMFSYCKALTSLDLQSFETNSVTTMNHMFWGCEALTSVGDLSGFNTAQVTDMKYMFYDCAALTSLDLSSFIPSQVVDMQDMFYGCKALTSIEGLSGWDTSSVTNMYSMFYDCAALTSLNVSGWDTSKVTSMGSMFDDCRALTSLDLSGWDTSKVTDMDSMFGGCRVLTSLDVSGWDTSKVTDMDNMFWACNALTSLDLSGWNTSSVTAMYGMFSYCKALTSLDLSGWDTSKVTGMSGMFEGCKKLQTVTLGKGFKFVGTDGYLPVPRAFNISGANGMWYDAADGAEYTPAELASVTRTEARTYVAVKPTTTNARAMSIMSNGNKISGYKISE